MTGAIGRCRVTVSSFGVVNDVSPSSEINVAAWM